MSAIEKRCKNYIFFWTCQDCQGNQLKKNSYKVFGFYRRKQIALCKHLSSSYIFVKHNNKFPLLKTKNEQYNFFIKKTVLLKIILNN